MMTFSLPRAVRALALGALVALSACQDSGLDLTASTGRRIIVGAEIPVAIESLEGAPDTVAPRYSAALAAEAEARQIVFVDGDKAPRFRLKGYLSAAPATDGVSIAYVWDVFDGARSRAQRITGAETVKRGVSQPWDAADEAVLRRVASRGMNEIAAFLVEQPRPDAPVAARTAAPRAGPAE